MELKIDVKGNPEVMKRIQDLAARYPEATAAALYQEGFDVWNDAAKRAPVETGVLRSSAYVAPPTMSKDGVAVEVGFGTSYAVVQHENEEFHHPRGGEAKYLAHAVDDIMGGYLDRVANRIQANVKNGVGVQPLNAPPAPYVSAVRAPGRGVSRLRRRR